MTGRARDPPLDKAGRGGELQPNEAERRAAVPKTRLHPAQAAETRLVSPSCPEPTPARPHAGSLTFSQRPPDTRAARAPPRSASRRVSGRCRRTSAFRRVSGRRRWASASRLVSGGVGGPRPLRGSQLLLSEWAETRPACPSGSRPAPPPPRSSFSRVAPLFSPSGNAFHCAASAAPEKEGEAAGRRKVGQGADKGARSFGPFCLGYGAEPPRAPAARRESPAAVCVQSLGSRARPLCGLRGKKDGVFCRQDSDPPRHPKIADSRSTASVPPCAPGLRFCSIFYLGGQVKKEKFLRTCFLFSGKRIEK